MILLFIFENWITGVPIVRNVSEIPQNNYGRQGLSHITVAGSVMHGFKEVAIVQNSLVLFKKNCVCVLVNLEGSCLTLIWCFQGPMNSGSCSYHLDLNICKSGWMLFLGRLRCGFRHLLRVLVHRFIGIHVKKSLWFWRGVVLFILLQIRIKITRAVLRSYRFSRIVHFLSLSMMLIRYISCFGLSCFECWPHWYR